MKYGLILYRNTDNLGDDIQSYATSRFLPHINYLIDREQMHNFYSNDGRQVAVICSGWFLYEHLNWPPSPYILPLNISMHFDTYYSRLWGRPLEKNCVLEGYGASWLNQYGPVGARDESTLCLLRQFHIEAYLSGCITLTLRPFENVEQHGKIVAVDIDDQLFQYLQKNTGTEILRRTHKIKMESYSLSERFSTVEDYLKSYQGASLVVTPRLHAALPAIALGTPVLFIKDARFLNRTGTYIPFMNAVLEDEILQGNSSILFNEPAPNPDIFARIRAQIDQRCQEFIQWAKETEGTVLTPRTIMHDTVKRTEHAKLLLQHISGCT